MASNDETDGHEAAKEHVYFALRRGVRPPALDTGGYWSYPVFLKRKRAEPVWLCLVCGTARNPEKKLTAIFRPKSALVLKPDTGAVARYTGFRLSRDPFPRQGWDRPIGMFPHKAVAEMKLDEFEGAERRLLALAGPALREFHAGNALPQEFRDLWLRLTHPALLPYVRLLAPAFFGALQVPGAGATEGAKEPEAAAGAAEEPSEKTPSEAPVGPAVTPPPHPATPEGAVPLPDLMTRARSLISESGQEQLRPEWRRIYGRMNRPAFSVVVAGEFSRGKSVLVNKLLGRDVLPVGNLPTTAMLTRITHGPEPSLWRIHADGRRERLPLAPESWNGLVASDDGIDPEGVLHVELPNGWLQSTGIEVYDAPGAGDLTGRRAEIATEAIASCDATLLTVSATMALSLTERAFMEEHVLARRIPRIAVVLTRLDEIDGSQRASVVSYAGDKLKEWATEAKLWCSHGADIVPADAEVEAAGPEAIRAALAGWASDEQHFRRRALQIASQLRDLVGMLRDGLALRLDALRATAEEREESLRAARQALDRRWLEWEDLRLEFEKREHETASWLEGEAMEAKDEIAEALTFQLSRAPNPKEWCEKDFPYLVRRELLGRTRSLNAGLEQRIGRDAGWLRAEVGKRFEWQLGLRRPDEIVNAEKGKLVAVGSDVGDLSRAQRVTQVAFGALTVVSIVVRKLYPIGIAVGVIGRVLTDQLLNKKRDEQRAELASGVEQAVDETIRSGISAAQDRLRSAYRGILDETRRQESVWAETRRKALSVGDADGTAGERENLEMMSREAEELIAALAPWTEGGDQ